MLAEKAPPQTHYVRRIISQICARLRNSLHYHLAGSRSVAWRSQAELPDRNRLYTVRPAGAKNKGNNGSTPSPSPVSRCRLLRSSVRAASKHKCQHECSFEGLAAISTTCANALGVCPRGHPTVVQWPVVLAIFPFQTFPVLSACSVGNGP